MDAQLHLLIATWGYFICMIVVIVFGFFVFFQKPRKQLYNVWLLFCLSMALYQLSFIVGINTIATSKFAYWIWYSNIAEDLFISLFTLHIFILATDSLSKFKNLLKTMYAIACVIIVASVISPHAFVVGVVPKLYFLSFIDTSGLFYYVIDCYFGLNFLASYFVLFYQRSRSGYEGKKRIDYYIAGLTFGLLAGLTAFAPDYNIPIDPAVSALLGLFIIPLVYGMIKKGLMDIRLVLRRTLIVTSFIVFIAILFISVSLLSSWLTIYFPSFGFYIVPLLASLILVPVGLFFYQKEKDREDLKYEFTTVITHKFRTPLTRIRWQTEDLASTEGIPEASKVEIAQINDSAVELIRLSNLLISADQMEQKNYLRSFSNIDLNELVNEVSLFFKKNFEIKKINFSIKASSDLPVIYGDKERISSVIHILLDNAFLYTKENGIIIVDLSVERETIKFSITDDGIGIDKKEQPHVFDRFYRGTLARRANTEGVGLELFVAKSSIERQGGTLGFKSEGEGKGSTFYFTLPTQIPEDKK